MEASSMRMFTRVYSLRKNTSNPSAKAGYLLTNANPIVIRGTYVIDYHLFSFARIWSRDMDWGLMFRSGIQLYKCDSFITQTLRFSKQCVPVWKLSSQWTNVLQKTTFLKTKNQILFIYVKIIGTLTPVCKKSSRVRNLKLICKHLSSYAAVNQFFHKRNKIFNVHCTLYSVVQRCYAQMLTKIQKITFSRII